MAKNIQLTIPEPCHANWNQMSPTEQGRFCGSCQKQVIDFSTMSDQQIIAYFKQPKESVCGRFYNDQLNRELAIPKKRLPWIRYFFQLAIPAFLISCKSSVQRTKGLILRSPIKKEVVQREEILGGLYVPAVNDTKTEQTATIRRSRSNHLVIGDTMAPQIMGKMRVKPDDIASVNNQSVDTAFSCSQPDTEIAVRTLDTLVLPPVQQHIVMGGLSVRRTFIKYKNPIAIIQNVIDTITKKVIIYPNPVPVGSLVNIKVDQVAQGRYQLQLFDNNGKMLLKEINDLSGQESIRLSIPKVDRGSYFIRLIDAKGRSYTGKLIIQ